VLWLLILPAVLLGASACPKALAPAAPPTRPQAATLPNLPAGMKLLSRQFWDNTSDDTKEDFFLQAVRPPAPGRWVHRDPESVTKAMPVPAPPGAWAPDVTKVLEVALPGGQRGGTAPDKIVLGLSPGWAELYIYEQILFSPDYLALNNQQKHLWIRRIGDPGSGFFFQFRGRSAREHHISMNSQGLPNSERTLRPNQGSDPDLHDGRVHTIEYYLKADSGPLSRDGVVAVWIDGRPVLRYTDVDLFDPTEKRLFGLLRYEHTFGGGRRPVPPGSRYAIYIGATQVYGR